MNRKKWKMEAGKKVVKRRTKYGRKISKGVGEWEENA